MDDHEGQAGQQSHRGVRDLKLVLDGLKQDRDELSVDEVEDRHQEEDAEDVVGVAGTAAGNRLQRWASVP